MTIIAFLLMLTYLVWIGLITYGWFRLDSREINARTYKTVTLIVCAKNEAEYLPGLLEDISRLNYPKRFLQLILINDHSEDATLKLMSEAETGVSKTIIINAASSGISGKKQAVRLAAKMAKSDYLYFTDADCRLNPDILINLVNFAAQNRYKLVSAPVVYKKISGLIQTAFRLEFASLVAAGAGGIGIRHPFMCNGANMLVETKTYQELHFSDTKEISGDDVFALHHVKEKFGAKVIGFCKHRESIVVTYPPKNFQEFLAQREKWASKTPAYQDRFSLFTAGLIFSYALFTVICVIGSFFSLELLYILIILYGVKMLSDFFLLRGFSRFVNDKGMMKIYPIVQLVYPFYIVFSAFAALVYKKIKK